MPQQERPRASRPRVSGRRYLDPLYGGYREYGATRYRRLVAGAERAARRPLLQPPAWPGSVCRRARVTVAPSPAAAAAGLETNGSGMTIEAIGTEQKLITRWLSHRPPVRDVTCNSPNAHYRYVASVFRIRA